MINLTNALPNSFFPASGEILQVIGISEARAIEILLSQGFQSFVGHTSFAQVLTGRTGINIPSNRAFAPSPIITGEPTLVAAVQPPRRLGEGEVWSEEEILTMPISWVLVGTPESLTAFN
jgi:hypothetical protein